MCHPYLFQIGWWIDALIRLVATIAPTWQPPRTSAAWSRKPDPPLQTATGKPWNSPRIRATRREPVAMERASVRPSAPPTGARPQPRSTPPRQRHAPHRLLPTRQPHPHPLPPSGAPNPTGRRRSAWRLRVPILRAILSTSSPAGRRMTETPPRAVPRIHLAPLVFSNGRPTVTGRSNWAARGGRTDRPHRPATG